MAFPIDFSSSTPTTSAPTRAATTADPTQAAAVDPSVIPRPSAAQFAQTTAFLDQARGDVQSLRMAPPALTLQGQRANPALGPTDSKGVADFMKSYQARFAEWDQKSGQKGYLSEADIDKLMQDPSYHGDDAATLATLKAMQAAANGNQEEMRFNKDGATSVTRSPNSDGSGKPTGNLDWKGLAPLASMYYGTARDKISQASHDLFASPDGLPHPGSTQQGGITDCTLMSAATSMAQQKPDALKNMIHKDADGRYTVSFPGHKPVTVNAPTDAEIGNYASSGRDGMWLTVLEKAYGSARQQDGTARLGPTNDTSLKEPLDGGDGRDFPGAGIQALTGEFAASLPLGDYGRGQPPPPNAPDPRKLLTYAMDNKLLAVAGTGPAPPAGAATASSPQTGHSYTVMKYDPKTDMVTLRNPDPSFSRTREQTIPFKQFFQQFSDLTVQAGPQYPNASAATMQ